MRRLRLVLTGDVQGVGFRSWTHFFVRKNIPSVAGWVKNREDGTVEVVAEGQESDLRKLLEVCKDGPEIASVEHVQEEWQDATGEFIRFEIRR